MADYLNNRKRHELARLELEGNMSIQVVAGDSVGPEYLSIACRDADNRETKFP